MIPLHDSNPRHRFPVVTIACIGLCILVFIQQLQLGQAMQQFVYAWGLIPARLMGAAQLPFEAPPASWTLLTSMFLHGSIPHLGGNMLYLWTFGDNVEDRLGHARFLLFYIICGLAAAGTQILIDPTSTIPMVGASGAIAGVLGAYLVLFPHALVYVYFPYLGIQMVRARYVLATWFIYQFILGVADLGAGSGGGVAFWAHIGGFVAGWLLAMLLLRPPPRRPRAQLWE